MALRLIRFFTFIFVITLWRTVEARDEDLPIVDQFKRWTQVASIIVTKDGPPVPFSIIRKGGSAYVGVTYKKMINDTIEGSTSKPCTLSHENRCKVAVSSPGRVGELHYRFKDPARNLKGHATQTFLACRCLKHSCGHSIVMEVRKFKKSNICLYPKINDKWMDCHSEMLKVDDGPVVDPKFEFDQKPRVKASSRIPIGASGFWLADGNRQLEKGIDEKDLKQMKDVSFTDILAEYGEIGDQIFFNSSDPQQVQNVLRSTVKETDQDTCRKLYYYARQGSIYNGAQQDLVSIATEESSFITPRPTEVSLTDTVLAIGAAFAGLFATFRLFASINELLKKYRAAKLRQKKDDGDHEHKKVQVKWVGIWLRLFAMAFIVGPAELVALFFAFFSHNNYINWITFFTWMDISVALSPGVGMCEPSTKCSAEGSVYIATMLLGTVGHYSNTRGRWIALLAVMVFVLVSFSILLLEIIRRVVVFRKDFGGEEDQKTDQHSS